MTTTPIILIFGLLVATCVIAYWSDNLGKKLGKQRISLLGLRPRQTATLISMVSSVGIMVFTLLVLLLFSESVRNALLHYDTVRADLNRARRQNVVAQQQIAANTREMEVLSAKVEAAGKELAVARGQVEKTRALIRNTQSQLQSAQQRLNSARSRLRASEKSRDVARAAEQRARRSATRATQQWRTAEDRYAQAQQLYTRAQGKLANAQKRLQQLTGNLRRVNLELSRRTASLQAVEKELGATEEKLGATEKKLGATEQRLASTEEKLDVTERNLSVAERNFLDTQKTLSLQAVEVARLKEEQGRLQQEINILRQAIDEAAGQIELANRILSEPISIEAGTVFAANALPSRLSHVQARAALQALAQQARTSLQKREPPRRLQIYAEISDENTRILLEEEELIEQLAAYLVQMARPVSVRVVAARDHIEADTTVVGRFLMVPVRVAYERGDTLASAVVDGRQSDALIFRGLLQLTDRGASEARRRGVVPLVTSRDEPFFAGGTNERIFETLRRIGQLAKPVTVRLVADGDVSTVEPVKVRFEISDAPDSDDS